MSVERGAGNPRIMNGSDERGGAKLGITSPHLPARGIPALWQKSPRSTDMPSARVLMVVVAVVAAREKASDLVIVLVAIQRNKRTNRQDNTGGNKQTVNYR
eukprot:scaffold3355_cov291-Chaetoceros_neogracile.AAC.2